MIFIGRCHVAALLRSLAVSLLLVSTDRISAIAQLGNNTACGLVLNVSEFPVPAIDAYNCLTSVPFNGTVAKQLVSYLRDTWQFQSTIAYLANPPPSYQQPAVDLIGGLDLIQSQIDAAVFDNEYAFEAAVQALIYRAHEGHLHFVGGALNVFLFNTPLSIVSVSTDGLQTPKVYSGGKTSPISCAKMLFCDANVPKMILPQRPLATPSVGHLLLSQKSTGKMYTLSYIDSARSNLTAPLSRTATTTS